MYALLIHLNRPPELTQLADTNRVVFDAADDERNKAIYDGIGKVLIPIGYDEAGIEPLEYAEVKAYMHPDLVEQIKTDAPRRRVEPSY